MKKPDPQVALLLEEASQILLELNSMRGECSEFASQVVSQKPLDDVDLDECARLDEALARAHGVLQGAIAAIKAGRAKRKRRRK